jgi:hypothetical protein
MIRYGLVCLLLGIPSWGQATGPKSAVPAQQHAAPSTATTTTANSGQAVTSIAALDKPIITIVGLCDSPSADNGDPADCKTVITKAQFEKLIDAVQPGMPARARREFALSYADALVMTRKAEQMGLDKEANYEEQMRLARVQILSRDLKKAIQDRVSQIPDRDIEHYYRSNTARFEKAVMDRIYIPKTQQPGSASDKKLNDADRQKRLHESGQRMKEEADNLRERAVAGEEFTKLQADAYQVAGIKSAAPDTSIGIRRTSLPPNQASVMDLKPGEVSSVLEDPNGYVIYRVKTKETLPLDQAREEIKATLRSQRMQDEMRDIQDSATAALDESYFSRRRQTTMETGEPTKAAPKVDPSQPE